jgi:hypothetical protein
MDKIKKSVSHLLCAKVELEYFTRINTPHFIRRALEDIDKAIDLLSWDEESEVDGE